ncbi:MAG: hypothetical protein EHM42_10420, partial [Planctomycetaceae bacterium]
MCRWIVLTVLLGCLAPAGAGRVEAVEFSAMLKRVPGETNLLVMVDAERLMASPIAQEREWQKKRATDAQLRVVLLPPGAKKLIRAVQVDLHARDHSTEITLVDFPKAPPFEKVAERHQGYIEKISNVDAVWLPQGAYGVK